MIVRDAKESDAYSIVKLYQEFSIESNQPLGVPPSINGGKFVVCESNSVLIGYGTACVITYYGKEFTQGEHIYVTPGFRGTKAASLIYLALRRWARMNAKPIILLSEPSELGMWQRKGYKAIRHIMVKELK